MSRDELLGRLQKYEWTDVEFKQARRAVPKSAYETVSAFANTAGGWLVFGVRDREGKFEVVGVLEVDKVQNAFLSTLRSAQKVSCRIEVQEEIQEFDGKPLLVFYIPEAPRADKPVYLHGDFRQAFVRRGGGDEKCTPEEIKRFLRDASDRPYDGELIEDLDAEDFFDPASVGWYRRVFNRLNPGRHETLSDTEFLNEWGFLVERRDRLLPTRAAVALFGEAKYVRQLLPRPVVDCQFVNSDFDAWLPERRWQDRIVVEENLVQAWLLLAERYMRQAERPFGVDSTTLRRDDDPPDYISFREAAINLLIHQDYGDHGRKASIRFFRDRTVFWNPGDAFAKSEELLDPTEKEIRNPSIVAAFRRIGLSEQAGTGVRAIFREWQKMGHVPPLIENDRSKKTFELQLLREELLTEEQQLFQTDLGVRLTEAQARLFAFCCRQGQVSLMDAKAVTSRSGPEARKELDSLVTQVLLQPVQQGQLYQIADHLQDRYQAWGLRAGASDQVADRSGDLVTDQVRERHADLVTDQVVRPEPDLVTDQVLRRLNQTQWLIVEACEVPRSLADLMQKAGLTHRTFFRRKHLRPLHKVGIIRMTNPDNPQASNQKYVLTEAGVELKVRRLKKGDKSGPSQDEG